MHTEYTDILSRIEDKPVWFDEAAVPRFDPFKPDHMANIYANEAVLARIECQACQTPFDVAFSSPMGFRESFHAAALQGPIGLLRHDILSRSLHYGDPPNVRCCAAGPTMNSVPRQVRQYWVKPFFLGEGIVMRRIGASDREVPTIEDLKAMDWRREATFEIDITPDWAS